MDKLNPTTGYKGDDTRAAAPTDIVVSDIVSQVANWYVSQNTSTSNADQLPWLLSQGWLVDSETDSTETITVDGVSTDITTTTWKLTRQALKPEAAIKDLASDFIEAYNEGRTLNDDRYDDIVTLYSALIDKTEDELDDIEDDDSIYKDLVDVIIDGMDADYTAHETTVDGLFNDYGTAQRAEVDRKFDAKSSAQEADLIRRGLRNTTTWNAVDAGIERERAIADNELEDSILERKQKHEDRLYTLRVDLDKGILAARDRLQSQIQDQDVQRLDMRNRIMQALMNFMERRTDSYPDLGALNQLVTQLGASQTTYSAP